MSMFHTEGYVKAVFTGDKSDGNKKVSFKLEPIAPYIFEKKKDDGSTERCLLLVNDAKDPGAAKIVKTNQSFGAPEPVDLHSLIIVKANHLKVRVEVDLKYEVKTLTVL